MNDSTNYFFSRCTELLHEKTFDTYRVNLHNPITILYELEKCINKFNNKRIRHYDPTITSIGEEAKSLLNNEYADAVLEFKSFPKKSVIDSLEECCIKNRDGKRTRGMSLMCKTVCRENMTICNSLSNNISEMLIRNDANEYPRLDVYTSWLISQLQYEGFSRKYVINHIRTTQKVINRGVSIIDAFIKLMEYFTKESEDYEVLFKLKSNTQEPIKLASLSIEEIESFPAGFKSNKYINERFKEKLEGEIYLKVRVTVHDYWSALKKANQLISETIELNFLHDSEIKISVENQALAIHVESQRIRMESIHEKLDGFYNYKEPSFNRFIENYKKLEVDKVAHDKIRSAIRFYTLGNESMDIEHKTLNYWIGLEQLFATVDKDEDSIVRIKTYYKAISGVYYLQRRSTYLIESLSRAGVDMNVADLNPGSTIDSTFLSPLLKTRLAEYLVWLNDKKQLRTILEKHGKKLDQHLTRIYRVRNELVHEGKTTVDLFLVAGHLRHYLIFSIEQITNELVENPTLEYLDDVFTYYESMFECIKNATNIQEVFAQKTYSGYME